ncbi:sphingomyelin phosphodiesterase [Phanerochaete sordida]|uniref:Sphingomyelin phosphodiesterase n=1 Tax=Phanerochaete sordida TaxID=48140 RepID=A0A9P3LNR3_9APHY|nr:sphingomyelin phosphodiesterase [Phanerochaete sordida]
MLLKGLLTVLPLLGRLRGAAGDLLSDIENALANATDCASCHALLLPLQTLAHLGNAAFVDTIVALCDASGLEDPDVCQGAIGLEGPILAHDLRQISALGQTATKFCDAVFGLCDPPPVNAFAVPFPRAAPAHPRTFKSTGRPPFQVVHISDVHIDRFYTVGSEANCTKPICCRNFADQSGAPSEPAGPNGNAHCDSPVVLADSLLEATEQFAPDAAFTLFTGDVVEGAVWLVNETEVTNDLAAFNAEMAAKLKGPIFPAIGNHDSVPVNSFPRNTTVTTIGSQFVFDTQSAGWAQFIGAAAAAEVDHNSGSYSVVVSGMNLRIISVNTQYWYKQNFWVYDSDTQQPDPNGLLAFMVQELQAAEDAGQRAFIIGHMPMGKEDALNDQSNYYNQITQRYKNTIAAQFFGHSHKDQFEIAYSDFNDQTAETATSIAIIAPALTPTSGNPAFKIYDIDPDTFEIMDARVYITNITAPDFQTSAPQWELFYSARETYGPLVTPPLPASAPLDAAFWHNLTEVFAANDTAFQMFNTFLSRGGDVQPCDDDCKTVTICDMRALRAENNCDNPTPGLMFKRDGNGAEPPVSESDACEGHGTAHILKALVSRSQNDHAQNFARVRRSDRVPRSVLQD